ncbi:MAG: RES family NAD+ phosphorylase [Pseudomonas sp.]
MDFEGLTLASNPVTGYRLINSRFPPIRLFDDVASPEEFEALYALQARTNPRILGELGRLELIPRSEIPFGIPGCSYATAPFNHINPDGSRFSSGEYGVLYIADEIKTALAEVAYHQQRYWKGVHGRKFDRVMLRGLNCRFDEGQMLDATGLAESDPVRDPSDYTAARQLAREVRKAGRAGIRYKSARRHGSTCWALFTPRPVTSIKQTAHYEMVWDGSEIVAINQLKALQT